MQVGTKVGRQLRHSMYARLRPGSQTCKQVSRQVRRKVCRQVGRTAGSQEVKQTGMLGGKPTFRQSDKPVSQILVHISAMCTCVCLLQWNLNTPAS